MGDALAAALMTARGFKEDDFARFHPGGSLGRRLLTRVGDEMKRMPLPVCAPDAPVRDLILRMTEGRMGLIVVTDDTGHILGLITDGDLRRALAHTLDADFFALEARNIMSNTPRTITPDEKVAVADEIMQEAKITALLVADADGVLLGVYHRIA
jgi:arabinose-5-phosphate isomerase